MPLYLIRHGATEWSESGRHTGRTDIGLLPLGERQAVALGGALEGKTFARVFSSPLTRASRTAELAGLGGNLELSHLLLEMDYGADEGKTRAQIREERPNWDVFFHGTRGGESIYDVCARAAKFLRELGAAADNEDVAIFSHGHFLRLFAATYLGLSPQRGRSMNLGPASVSILAKQYEFPSIECWNDRSHLRDLG